MSKQEKYAKRRVWQLSMLMAVAAAAVAAHQVGPFWTHLQAPPPAFLVLVPLFALGEIIVIHLPSQRTSHSHTLREFPVIAGLTFLAPGAYLLAYVVGGGLALLFWSRQRGLKLAFNLSMFSLEAALGAATYTAIMGTA